MEQKRYTINELCELSGYSRRTIRYYIQEGLVDPPAGRGRGGFYFDSHLKRLQEIKALQERGLKLGVIQGLLGRGGDKGLRYMRELWVRYPVGAGVEIHVSRDVEQRMGRKISEIIRAARLILESGGGEDG